MLLSIFHFKLFNWNAIRSATWLKPTSAFVKHKKQSFNCTVLFSLDFRLPWFEKCLWIYWGYEFTKRLFVFEASKWSTGFKTEVKLKQITSYSCKWNVNNWNSTCDIIFSAATRYEFFFQQTNCTCRRSVMQSCENCKWISILALYASGENANFGFYFYVRFKKCSSFPPPKHHQYHLNNTAIVFDLNRQKVFCVLKFVQWTCEHAF